MWELRFHGITLRWPCDPGSENDWLLTHHQVMASAVSRTLCLAGQFVSHCTALPDGFGEIITCSLRDLLMLDLIVACLDKANKRIHV